MIRDVQFALANKVRIDVTASNCLVSETDLLVMIERGFYSFTQHTLRIVSKSGARIPMSLAATVMVQLR